MRYTLVLDAMGVIFMSADDVVELLQPFISARGGNTAPDLVNEFYARASLGEFSPGEFWRCVGLDESIEDEYLAEHRLAEGAIEFLANPPPTIGSVWCLSNDVGRWSSKLRHRFSLDKYLAGAVISGDVGFRKPSREIYEILLSQIDEPADHVVFVDDRPKNLATAQELGIRAVQFGSAEHLHCAVDHYAATFGDLAKLLRQLP
jgi:FMN phosphatase YigB (HAD superfamily)